MATVVLPPPLRRQAGGADRIGVPGTTAGAVLRALERSHPTLRGWVLDERGQLRQHVSLFVNDRHATLDEPLAEGDELYIVQAISGGAPDAAEVLVGTKKGLFVLRGTRGGPLDRAHRAFPGQSVEYAIRDPRSGLYLASVTHGQFGPRVFWTEEPTGEWTQAVGPAFGPEDGAAVARVWTLVPGAGDGEVWAGVAPAALFRSADGGRSWRLVRGLWEQPSRPEWEGGLGGLALHSICPYPGDPRRLAVGISAAGVWKTADGGVSWRHRVGGLVPRYLPEEARATTRTHCVHNMHRAGGQPDTLYMQFHGGVYRSDDDGESWVDIGADGGLPADFGFPLVTDPHSPDRAFVIPLAADHDRVPPEGKLRVYETADRGVTWRALGRGLPQEDAWVTVLRQAFCHDGRQPLGLYFGTEQGTVYGSADGGESWRAAAVNLPPVLSVRVAG